MCIIKLYINFFKFWIIVIGCILSGKCEKDLYFGGVEIFWFIYIIYIGVC